LVCCHAGTEPSAREREPRACTPGAITHRAGCLHGAVVRLSFCLGMEAQLLPKDRIIVALDVPSGDEALSLVSQLKNHVGMFKVGLELTSSAGDAIVPRLVGAGARVFLTGS